MTKSDDPGPHEQILLADIFRPLIPRGRQIKRGTIVATVIVALLGGVYFFVQPTTRSASLAFRPLFEGADEGEYPNDLPFAPTDIVDPSIVNQVYARNGIQEYCASDEFQSGFVVRASSPGLLFLSLEFQALLANDQLTAIERDQLQTEYENRRAALQSQYEIGFVYPRPCATLPEPVVFKAMTDVLETWARDSDEKRGVMKFRVSVLSPRVFDQVESGENLLIRSDLLRTAVMRVIRNMTDVEELPGAELVRGSDRSTSVAEARAELEDLLQAQLEPLIFAAGSGLGPASMRFLRQAMQSAEIRFNAAQKRAETYRQALREYSGTASPPPTSDPSRDRPESQGGDVLALTPQIDRTFIDRIVELSSPNLAFRQEITRGTIEASIEAAERGAVVEQYRLLLSALEQGGGGSLAPDVADKALQRVVAQAKDATRRFNEIYDEFTRVALRPGPAMYRIEQPAEGFAVRSFAGRDYVLLVLAIALATPILLAVMFLLLYYGRSFVKTVR